MSLYSKMKITPILPQRHSNILENLDIAIPGVESSKVIGHQRKTEAGTLRECCRPLIDYF